MQRKFLPKIMILLVLAVIGCSRHDQREGYLFNLDLACQKDLETGTMTDCVRNSFQGYGRTLSGESAIAVQKEEREWVIQDRGHKKEYLVVREENALKVYEDRIGLEAIKENRVGLDYKQNQSLFPELDDLIKKWVTAQAQEQYGVSSAWKGQLQELSRSHFSMIVEGLSGNDPFHQAVAAAALGFSNDVRAIPYLLEAVANGSPAVRCNAALGMGQIEFSGLPQEISQKVATALTRSLEKDPDEAVRGMAAFAISQVVSEETDWGALPYLLDAIGDKSPNVRNHVVLALGKIRHPEGIKAIIAGALDDENPGVRYNAIRALSRAESDEVDISVVLVKKLRDPSPVVAGAAYYVLKYRTGQDLGPTPEKWEEWAGISSTR